MNHKNIYSAPLYRLMIVNKLYVRFGSMFSSIYKHHIVIVNFWHFSLPFTIGFCIVCILAFAKSNENKNNRERTFLQSHTNGTHRTCLYFVLLYQFELDCNSVYVKMPMEYPWILKTCLCLKMRVESTLVEQRAHQFAKMCKIWCVCVWKCFEAEVKVVVGRPCSLYFMYFWLFRVSLSIYWIFE